MVLIIIISASPVQVIHRSTHKNIGGYKMKRYGFIGAGNMATAIIKGLIKSNPENTENIFVYDISEEKLNLMKEQGVSICKDSSDVVKQSDIIVVAVKPQNYQEALAEIKNEVNDEKIVVSIAAGISIAFVRGAVEKECKVVRVMPNTPLLLSKGATALCPSENVSDEEFSPVLEMFSLSGAAEIFTEDYMNTIIAVNGSSPAYVYLFAKAMADYAKENGIDYDKALSLICATLEGSAAMLRESGDDPDTLIKKVSSPGGTTIEALKTLDEYKFYEGIKSAMDSCTKRAFELGK